MTSRDRLAGMLGMVRARDAALRLAQNQALPDGKGQIQSVLLYGPDSGALAQLAEVLAQAWLCTNPGLDNGACGACQSCHAALNQRHADLLKIEPQPPSHLIRLGAISASSNSAELSAQEFLRSFPMMGRNKVVMILGADRMNADAANAFLKTLEEPPERARIVMTAPAPSRLLPTVLSRCLALACELPSEAEFAPTAEKWGELAIFLEGSPERAASLAGQQEIYRGVLRMAKRVVSATPSEALAISEGLRELAEALEKKTGGGMRGAQAEILAAFALALKTQAIEMTPIVAEAHRRILGNGSAGLVFDALATSLVQK